MHDSDRTRHFLRQTLSIYRAKDEASRRESVSLEEEFKPENLDLLLPGQAPLQFEQIGRSVIKSGATCDGACVPALAKNRFRFGVVVRRSSVGVGKKRNRTAKLLAQLSPGLPQLPFHFASSKPCQDGVR